MMHEISELTAIYRLAIINYTPNHNLLFLKIFYKYA